MSRGIGEAAGIGRSAVEADIAAAARSARSLLGDETAGSLAFARTGVTASSVHAAAFRAGAFMEQASAMRAGGIALARTASANSVLARSFEVRNASGGPSGTVQVTGQSAVVRNSAGEIIGVSRRSGGQIDHFEPDGATVRGYSMVSELELSHFKHSPIASVARIGRENVGKSAASTINLGYLSAVSALGRLTAVTLPVSLSSSPTSTNSIPLTELAMNSDVSGDWVGFDKDGFGNIFIHSLTVIQEGVRLSGLSCRSREPSQFCVTAVQGTIDHRGIHLRDIAFLNYSPNRWGWNLRIMTFPFQGDPPSLVKGSWRAPSESGNISMVRATAPVPRFEGIWKGFDQDGFGSKSPLNLTISQHGPYLHASSGAATYSGVFLGGRASLGTHSENSIRLEAPKDDVLTGWITDPLSKQLYLTRQK